MSEVMLTDGDVSSIFHTCKKTIHRWRKRGYLGFIRVGRTIRIPQSAVDLLKAQFRILASPDRTEAERENYQREGAAFLAEHPDFPCSPENELKMLAWLDLHSLPMSAGSLAVAYEDLQRSGLIEPKQVSDEPQLQIKGGENV
jgi:excisionase family DNA binding protein